jgi:hypothetical protein
MSEDKLKIVQRMEFIKSECAGKKVLHLGCTNHPYTAEAIERGMLLHSELASITDSLYGFDYDEEGLETLRSYGYGDLYQADLEALEKVELNTTFDVIIAGEMIEHLSNPGLFLTGKKRFMRKQPRLVIPTINEYGAIRLAKYFLRVKSGRNEPVHPDHVAYYSYSTLKLLLERYGFAVPEFYFYDIGPEHRPSSRMIYNFISDFCVMFAPQMGDGVIAVCKTQNTETVE